MDHRSRLLRLLVERSLAIGEFTLAGGARSSFYIDVRRTAMSAEGQSLLGLVALDAIRGAGFTPEWIGGLTMGADPIAYAIAHRSWLEGSPVDAFSVRKEAKEHGTGRRIEGGLPRDRGTPVIIVEDALTTGGSALRAVEAVREHGAVVLGVLSVVDRQAGGAERLRDASIPLLPLFTARELLETAGHPELV